VAVVECPDSFVSPGFVDLQTALGGRGDDNEIASAFEPDARAVDFYHPEHEDFAKALAAGITTAGLSPGSMNVVGGVGVLVKTAGAGDRIVRDGAFMKLSMTRQALSEERAPTSPLGLLHMLRGQLTAAKSADAQSPMQAFASGRLRGLVAVQTRNEIASALDLASQFHLDLVLLGGDDAGRMLDELKAAQCAVVFGPFSFATPQRLLATPAQLVKNGTRVAFTSLAPSDAPEGLRLSAILAARNGLTEDEALRAITAVPAQLGGVESRVGTLAPGKDADLIVWSAPPLDARARIEAVYVRGVKVYPSNAPGHAKAP